MTTLGFSRRQDDAEVGLLHAEDSDDDCHPRTTSSSQPAPQMWPRDMIGRNMSAKMGSVASEKVSIRLAFLRKVFGILSFQIVLTTGICTALYAAPGTKEFIQQQ